MSATKEEIQRVMAWTGAMGCPPNTNATGGTITLCFCGDVPCECIRDRDRLRPEPDPNIAWSPGRFP